MMQFRDFCVKFDTIARFHKIFQISKSTNTGFTDPMSVLLFLIWRSRKWSRHFLSKHREMTAHFTKLGNFPNPLLVTCEKMDIANNVKRGSAHILERNLFCYSTKPYLTLMRSSFSSIGSAARKMKITVAAAWIRSMGRPET